MKHSQPLNLGAFSHKFSISLSAHWVSLVPNHSVYTAGAMSCTSPCLPALAGHRKVLQAPLVLRERLHLHILGKGLSVFALQTSTDTGNLEAESKNTPFSLFFQYIRWMGWCSLGVSHPLRAFWYIWQTFDRGPAVLRMLILYK